MAKLKDIGVIITGNTPKTSDPKNYETTDIPFIKPSNISDDAISYLHNSEFYISEYAREKSRIVPVDSILFTCIGIIGKIAVNKVECAFNQQINAIIPDKSKCLTDYLVYALQSKKRLLQETANAPVVPILNKTQFSEIEIELPSLEQQEKISVQLNKINDLISQRNLQLSKLDELVKSRFIELFGDPETNPKGLKKVLLSDIAKYYNGLTYVPDNVSEFGTVVLRSSNIQNSQLDFTDTVRVDCSVKEKLLVKENDILMCSRNGSARLVGKVALIKNLTEPMSFGAFMMIIRSKYYPYLMSYFQMDAFRRQIKTGATTTINQITGNMLNKISLPLPEMDDINEFAKFVEETDKLKFAVQQALDKAQLLFDSLMQKYFE